MAGEYRSYAKFLLLLLGLTSLMVVLGFVATRRVGGAEAVTAMFWGCGLSLLASAVGGLPQVLSGRSLQDAGALSLGSLALRMGITLLGLLAILLSTDISRRAFLLWVAISYLVLLIADVAFLLARSRVS